MSTEHSHRLVLELQAAACVRAGWVRAPGPLPQRRVDPFPLGVLDEDSPAWIVGATPTFTFPGESVPTVAQVGLGQNGLALWRSERPLRLQSTRAGSRLLVTFTRRRRWSSTVCRAARSR